ncbi:rRNA maturation RNase YbeY [Rhizobium sp. L1K21]|uniref:rRNA maturation RNase YbeY n=1 Tax=Rhizobium sp. L1K21 TaxID=2954933 RepID=UPI0020921868|nr:rRNA maturation RNase YbeY [Rhizobium sp. L1K21]MCO6187424.1 rRNA maturation RNase YbeY [Rhizobium sp. L1K21]
MATLKTLLDIQISVEADGWPDEAVLEKMSAPVLVAAANWLTDREDQPMPDEPAEVSLLFTDDATIQSINAEWRDKDKPTNVLSFPAFPLEPGGIPGPMLGDIIFARETIEREAAELEKPFDEHLSHLLVHGFLHLFGYDHIENDDAVTMEALETGILVSLGLSDPYADTDPI